MDASLAALVGVASLLLCFALLVLLVLYRIERRAYATVQHVDLCRAATTVPAASGEAPASGSMR